MQGVRVWMRRQAGAVLLMAALALCVKALVPQGYMLAMDGGLPTVVPCFGMASAPGTGSGPAMDGHGMHMAGAADDPSAGDMADDGAADMGADKPCAFTALSMGAVDTVAVFLVAALAYVFLRALWPVVLRPDLPRLRLVPPLRGPPLKV